LKVYSANRETQLRFIQKEPNVYGVNEDVDMFMSNFRTLPRHYINMTPEIKAEIFDIDTIQDVEKAYRGYRLLVYCIPPNPLIYWPCNMDGKVESSQYP
jgi:hypothetical protein